MNDDMRWAAYFAQVAEDLLADPGKLTFDRVVHRAVEVVPPADHCGITLRQRRGRAETVAATGDVVLDLDAAQYALGEGPCLDAAFESGSCVVDDLRTDGRWPRWSQVATEHGVHAALAIRLHADGTTLGALNLYAGRAGAFDQDSVDTALIFATHAAEALSKARLVGNLEAALESRHVIGMAQGSSRCATTCRTSRPSRSCSATPTTTTSSCVTSPGRCWRRASCPAPRAAPSSPTSMTWTRPECGPGGVAARG